MITFVCVCVTVPLAILPVYTVDWYVLFVSKKLLTYLLNTWGDREVTSSTSLSWTAAMLNVYFIWPKTGFKCRIMKILISSLFVNCVFWLAYNAIQEYTSWRLYYCNKYTSNMAVFSCRNLDLMGGGTTQPFTGAVGGWRRNGGHWHSVRKNIRIES